MGEIEHNHPLSFAAFGRTMDQMRQTFIMRLNGQLVTHGLNRCLSESKMVAGHHLNTLENTLAAKLIREESLSKTKAQL